MMMRHKFLTILIFVLALGVGIFLALPVQYAYTPAASKAVNEPSTEIHPYLETSSGDSIETGAVPVDEALLKLGRHAYHDESFGNEIFLQDVIGLLDGPLRPTGVIKAIAALKGKGTTNLRVEAAFDAVIGGRNFKKGEFLDTGLDVPEGALSVLGMKIEKEGTQLRAGITCAMCHSTVDEKTKRVIHGMPNWDLNTGLMLAMGSNSAAFFPHTKVDPKTLPRDPQHPELPDPVAFETAVDRALLGWGPGHFDSMVDLKAAPTKLPSSFTAGNWPYSFSGAFLAGPFKGLSVQTNNVHALNSDTFSHADSSMPQFGLEKEQYLAILLRNASAKKLRFDPSGKKKPSEILTENDITPGEPGLNEMVKLPTYPKASLAAPTSLWNSDKGYKVWEKVNGMSAWQNLIVPPKPDIAVTEDEIALGQRTFEKAKCQTCHSGNFMTNNHVVSENEVMTQSLRATAMKSTEKYKADSAIGYTFDQKVPLPENPKTFVLKTFVSPHEIDLANGWKNTEGGFKVPTLAGIYWTTPYLHDGAVAVGDTEEEVGVQATLGKYKRPNPVLSLKALIDRDLRAKVIAANKSDPVLVENHVEGVGHNFWVDQKAGFSAEEQSALIKYLLTYQPKGDRDGRSF
jgi:hypothetical protein